MLLVTAFASLAAKLIYDLVVLPLKGFGKIIIKRREKACETAAAKSTLSL
jgi:hypothetical protein